MDYDKASDWELVELTKGDLHFFKYIVERYENRIFHYLKRLSYYSQEDVEDMTQEVFIKIYSSLNSFSPSDKFSSLIYRVAHNHLVDCIRKSSCRVGQSHLDDAEALSLLRSEVNLEKEVAGQDASEKIKKVIDELSINYKEVLVLKFLEEKTIEEIGDILQKPQGTVATLLRRGREKLKQNLIDVKLDLRL